MIQLAGPARLWANSLDASLNQQNRIQQEATQAQQRIDTLDDESQQMLQEYHQLQADLNNLQKYTHQMQRMVDAQAARADAIERQTEGLQYTRERLLPLMLDMLDALEQYIAADTPFLLRERRLRLQGLRQLMDEPQTSLAEKYRRLLQAYSIEAEYAYSIEAYTDDLQFEQQTLTVDFLRLGRSGLYWLSLDGKQSGVWDPLKDRWLRLDSRYNRDLQQAIRVGRKQPPPQLLRLPFAAEPAS